MKSRHPWLQLQGGCLFAVFITTIAAPVAAQTSNFGTITLSTNSPQPVKIKASGYTGGNFSLSAISNEDRDKKKCLGFADPNPDHILVLEKEFNQLTVSIKSGDDTTLLIQEPDGTIRCGDDTNNSQDASISGKKWKSGTYRIWVGIFKQGIKRNYMLTVKEE
jgi:hypothetical protein